MPTPPCTRRRAPGAGAACSSPPRCTPAHANAPNSASELARAITDRQSHHRVPADVLDRHTPGGRRRGAGALAPPRARAGSIRRRSSRSPRKPGRSGSSASSSSTRPCSRPGAGSSGASSATTSPSTSTCRGSSWRAAPFVNLVMSHAAKSRSCGPNSSCSRPAKPPCSDAEPRRRPIGAGAAPARRAHRHRQLRHRRERALGAHRHRRRHLEARRFFGLANGFHRHRHAPRSSHGAARPCARDAGGRRSVSATPTSSATCDRLAATWSRATFWLRWPARRSGHDHSVLTAPTLPHRHAGRYPDARAVAAAAPARLVRCRRTPSHGAVSAIGAAGPSGATASTRRRRRPPATAIPDRPAGRRCTRCGNPACDSCLVQATVGSHCLELRQGRPTRRDDPRPVLVGPPTDPGDDVVDRRSTWRSSSTCCCSPATPVR